MNKKSKETCLKQTQKQTQRTIALKKNLKKRKESSGKYCCNNIITKDVCGQRRSDKKHIYKKGSTLTELREMGSPEFFSFCFFTSRKSKSQLVLWGRKDS